MSALATALARIGPEHDGLLMTPEEFDAIDDWDPEYQYELIQGVVVVNPIPLEGEADSNGELGYLLRAYAEPPPAGRVLDVTMSARYLHLPDGSRRRPDRVI